MDNRRALVTGGASGFGLETARALLAQGAQVAVADINADALHTAALDGAVPLEIDVTSSASVDRGLKPVPGIGLCSSVEGALGEKEPRLIGSRPGDLPCKSM